MRLRTFFLLVARYVFVWLQFPIHFGICWLAWSIGAWMGTPPEWSLETRLLINTIGAIAGLVINWREMKLRLETA